MLCYVDSSRARHVCALSSFLSSSVAVPLFSFDSVARTQAKVAGARTLRPLILIRPWSG
jgi:hypothetical protein